MHAEPAFAERCGTRPGDLARSNALARRTLALPLHQNLADDDVDVIADALARALMPTRRRPSARTT
jgi:dTDP-4-amino-4,6-dideoxygalactose transaminase